MHIPIFFEIGIPNLVCKCILGLQIVIYHFQVTVTLTLTTDLVLRIIVYRAYLIFFEVGISNLVCECIMGWQRVTYHFQVTVTLTSDLVFRIIVSAVYFLYYLR